MWIDSENFGILLAKKKGQRSLIDLEDTEFNVAFGDLTNDQKKMLPQVECDFNLYISGGRAPTKINGKVIKEKLYAKEDLIQLIKTIFNEKDRSSVCNRIIESGIHPVVIQQWLYQRCRHNPEALNVVAEAEQYVNYPKTYAHLISSEYLLGMKFGFPKKVRE